MACVTITLPVAASPPPGTSASPGFQYGRAGNISAGTYLQAVATVPTNTAGLIVPFTGFITRAWTTNEASNTYDLKVQNRVGAGFFDQGLTLSLVAARLIETSFAVPVTKGQELVMLMSAGSGRNVQAGLIIEQTA